MASATIALEVPSVPANLKREFARHDPVLLDRMTGDTATALRAAAPSLKTGGRAAGVSAKGFHHWWRGYSPVLHTKLFLHNLTLERGTSPGAVIVDLRTGIRQALLPMSDDALVERFHALMDRESETDGVTDRAQATVGHTRDLADLERKARAHAAALEELIPVLAELRARGIDPYERRV